MQSLALRLKDFKMVLQTQKETAKSAAGWPKGCSIAVNGRFRIQVRVKATCATFLLLVTADFAYIAADAETMGVSRRCPPHSGKSQELISYM